MGELDPKSELGKLLLALVYAVVNIEPNAFTQVNIEKALEDADKLSETTG